AVRALGARLRPAEHRAARHAHQRRALNRLDDSPQRGGAEVALVLREARREVDDAELAVGRGEHRLEHVRVLEIALHAVLPARWCNLERAALGVEQPAEDGRRVEARQAGPLDAALARDERRELTI